jgi:hypothetical protein
MSCALGAYTFKEVFVAGAFCLSQALNAARELPQKEALSVF